MIILKTEKDKSNSKNGIHNNGSLVRTGQKGAIDTIST